MGRPTVEIVDKALTQAAMEIDFLMQVTPVNTAEAFGACRDSGFKEEPKFVYRPRSIDPRTTTDQLVALPVEEIDDPVIRDLFIGKRSELVAHVELIDAVDTPRFRDLSVQVFGDVDDGLLDAAEMILESVPPVSSSESRVGAIEIAARADRELYDYCSSHPDLDCRVEIRDDVTDLMVSQGNLLVGARSSFRAERVEALIQHEIGTHVVTFYNGSRQPFLILCAGLAGYEETQEGLALLAEYMVDGLDAERVRILAARVIAVKRMLEGGSFVGIFRELHDRVGLVEHAAWTITARVVRSGGLTKDAIYLRGLTNLVAYLRAGGSLQPLLVGKISLEHVDAVEELLARGTLRPPMLIPRWLRIPDVEDRLGRVRSMQGVVGLVARKIAP